MLAAGVGVLEVEGLAAAAAGSVLLMPVVVHERRWSGRAPCMRSTAALSIVASPSRRAPRRWQLLRPGGLVLTRRLWLRR
jgi:hypothetical protein